MIRQVLLRQRNILGGDDALRGTALAYLENVLPDAVRRALWPLLRAPDRLRPPG